MNRFIRYILPAFMVCTLCSARVTAEEETASEDFVSAETMPAEEESGPETVPDAHEESTEEAPAQEAEDAETVPESAADGGEADGEDVTEEQAESENAVLAEAPVLPDTAQLLSEGTVTSKGQIASFKSVIAAGAGLEYMNMFFLEDYPVYCIEPNVAIPMTDGTGPYYTGTEWTDLSEEDRLYCKRVAYFGYGYPDTGTEPVSYAATQMLIWQRTSPRFYEKTIYKTFNMCPGVSFGRQTCRLGTAALDEKMAQILELANGFDKVPSFADSHHGISTFDVQWDETLDLEDQSCTLEQFEPAEVPAGVNVRIDGNHLFVDVDDLYFDGDEDGAVISFHRKEEYWNAMLSGIMLYTSGSSQKLIAENGLFPTYEFSVRICMPETSVRIIKEDEYGNALSGSTVFTLAWKEDPLKQYADDPHWTDIHPKETAVNDDGGEMMYPLTDKDGEVLLFETDESGCVQITGLPVRKSWWIREVQTAPSCIADGGAYEIESGEEPAEYVFVNRLRDTVLELAKCDRDSESRKLSDAKYFILDLNPQTADPIGSGTVQNREISYEQFSESLPAVSAGDRIMVGVKSFEIVSLGESGAVLRDDSGTETEVGPETKEPCTLDEILGQKKSVGRGDAVEIDGQTYTVLYVSDDQGFIRLEGRGTVSDVHREPPAANRMRIDFLRKGQSYDLNAFSPAAKYRLKKPNIQIELTDSMIRSDAAAYADVLCLDENGGTLSELHIVFGSEEKTEEGQLIFQGYTGRQYTRICDPLRHNAPAAGLRILVCSDQSCSQPAAELRSDAYGCLRTDSLSAGTYWYTNPLSLETESFTVSGSRQAEGQLRIDHLKYGRRYLVCETDPPAGYDYGEEEPCRIFDMTLNEGKTEYHEELFNSLRRFHLRVLKVDSDDHAVPLNNAWFTVEDLSDEEEGGPAKSSYVQKVSITDIPEGSCAGDTFPVWHAKEGGELITWRLEKISGNSLTVCRMVNGSFQETHEVPRRGYDCAAGLLYSDIAKALLTLKEGAVFQTAEKEDASLIRTYRILSLTAGDAYDLFGQPVSGSMIYEAVVADECDSNLSPIRLYSGGLNPSNEQIGLDEYVSGALLIKKTVMKNAAPISPEQLSSLPASDIRPGGTISLQVSRTAEMPDFSTVKKAYENGSTALRCGGAEWGLRKTEAGYAVALDGREYLLEAITVPGAAEYAAAENMTVLDLVRSDEGTVASLTLKDSRGSTWQINRDGKSEVLSGRCGVYASVYDMNGNMVKDGYTGSDGRLLFEGLPEGDYLLKCEGSEEMRHVEKGMADVANLKYGHKIRICETKSPLGYMIGNACAVIIPTGDDTDTITNMRPNARVVTHVRRILRMRKMGDDE